MSDYNPTLIVSTCRMDTSNESCTLKKNYYYN